MNRLRRLLLASSAVMAWVSCAPEFEPPSEIQSLRVLAVKKSEPYAQPGDTVTLSMALARGLEPEESDAGESDAGESEASEFDAGEFDAGESDAAPVQILWLAGCENPPGDLFARCFETLDEEAVQTGAGLQFSFEVSPTIISRRPTPVDPDQPPYGLAYVFFAACAGEVRFVEPDEEQAFPIGCFSPSGERLGADHFVAGYTTVFVYDEFDNDNPKITGFTIDGEPVEAECIGDACLPLIAEELGLPPSGTGSGLGDGGRFDGGLPDGGSFDVGLPDGGSFDGGRLEGGISDASVIDATGIGDSQARAPRPATPGPCETDSPTCLRACFGDDDCAEHDVKVVIDRDSIEPDTVAEARGGKKLLEQMWINYFTTRGSLEPDVTLLNDATSGFNPDHATTLTAPDEPGIFRFWAVVRDSRGGASWARLRLQAR